MTSTGMTSTILYGRATASIQLATAIQQCKDNLKKAVALLYTPHRCYLAVLTDEGHCVDEQAQAVDYKAVFEARLFTPECEFRWLNHTGGLGRAVLLSESKIDPYLEQALADLQALDTLPQQYILWGEGIEQSADDDWSTLATARIGRLPIPIKGIDLNKGACLKSREYLAAETEFGNMAVVEERLLSLTPIDIPKA